MTLKDEDGRETTVVSYCGALPAPDVSTDARDSNHRPPAPPPDSWAADDANKVTIWTIEMAPGAAWTLPATDPKCNRKLFFFRGSNVEVGGQAVPGTSGMTLRPDTNVELRNGEETAEFLLLEGIPIGEPVAQYGPFVMNSEAEIRQAFADYQKTQFGGWPWPSDDPTHSRDTDRFARHADGRVEEGG